MKYKTLTIIGTSHIAIESLENVKKTIQKEKPDIIALELDKQRLASLLKEQRAKPKLSDIRKIGLKGWLFMLIGSYVERKLGNIVKVKPGDEMKLAYTLAQEMKIRVALIDQDIIITLQNISRAFGFKEKWHLFVDIIKAMLFKKERVRFDLRKVPSDELIEKMIGEVKKRYPSLHKVLIEDRNKVMAKRLYGLMQRFPEQKIIAVMGAGHEKEVINLIKDMEKKSS